MDWSLQVHAHITWPIAIFFDTKDGATPNKSWVLKMANMQSTSVTELHTKLTISLSQEDIVSMKIFIQPVDTKGFTCWFKRAYSTEISSGI